MFLRYRFWQANSVDRDTNIVQTFLALQDRRKFTITRNIKKNENEEKLFIFSFKLSTKDKE